jgi:hypothetical protein
MYLKRSASCPNSQRAACNECWEGSFVHPSLRETFVSSLLGCSFFAFSTPHSKVLRYLVVHVCRIFFLLLKSVKKGIYIQRYTRIWKRWQSAFSSAFYFFFAGCGGFTSCALMTLPCAIRLARGLATPLPSATALIISVKLNFNGLWIFCGLLISVFQSVHCRATADYQSRLIQHP